MCIFISPFSSEAKSVAFLTVYAPKLRKHVGKINVLYGRFVRHLFNLTLLEQLMVKDRF